MLWAEVPFRKRAAGSRLQVFLKANGFPFGRELDRDDKRPWTMANGVAGRTVIVPLEASFHIVCDADVVSHWVSVASEDVDDPFFDSMHARHGRTLWAGTELAEFGSVFAAGALFLQQGCALRVAETETPT
jgi:hypothetical protein